MNNTFDPITLLLIAAAVVVFFKLRGVLGQKTGHQEPFDPFQGKNETKSNSSDEKTKEDTNVVQMPGTKPAGTRQAADTPSIEGSTGDAALDASLRKISNLDHQFDPESFIKGAKAAYEMIVTAFAQGDTKTLKDLLSKEVFSGFSSAIEERKAQGVEMTTQFIGIEDAKILKAELEGSNAFITVKIVSELVSVVHDKSGNVVEGDPTEVQEITDIWTFERNLSSKDPNWRLVATDGEES